MYRQLRGLYNGAALSGGLKVGGGIGETLKTLYGGWDPQEPNGSNAAADMMRRIEARYGIPRYTLDDISGRIWTYDTYLMQGDPAGARRYKASLGMSPLMQKAWTYLRTKIHRGGTRKKVTKADRIAARNRRQQRMAYLRQSPWVGSDPYVNNQLTKSYVGLASWRPKKGQPGYVDYRPNYIMAQLSRDVAAAQAAQAARAAAQAAAAAAAASVPGSPASIPATPVDQPVNAADYDEGDDSDLEGTYEE